MTEIDVRPLSDELDFGARVRGISRSVLEDAEIRGKLMQVFEDRGMIVFEEVEPSDEMQAALSDVFGPPRDRFVSAVPKDEKIPGLIKISAEPSNTTVIEVDGERLAGVVGWHFDACYTDALNRGGVLRVETAPPEGGMTGFADGIQIYRDLPKEWQQTAEELSIVYSQERMLHQQRFGMPKDFRLISLQTEARKLLDFIKDDPRAVHPAVWQRKTGEKVLHVGPWQAAGIAGRMDAEGDAILEDLCQIVYKVMKPYWHKWKTTDMVIWDNWRFVHAVSGYDPKFARSAQRTTIQGDYGLGCFEQDWKGQSHVSS